MGRVFTWRELRDNRVPRAEDFRDVVQTLRRELTADPDVIGAILCGSVGGKTFGPRSDVDCMILYKQSERGGYPLESLSRVARYATTRNVPVEFIPVDAAVSASGITTFDAPFGLHLKKMADKGGCIKDNPLLICRIDMERIAADILQYFAVKFEKLSKYMIEINGGEVSEEKTCHILQKALQAPVHIARRTLLWLGHDLENDSRASVLSEFEDRVGGRLWAMIRDTMKPLENEYNDNVKARIKDKNWAAYREMIVNLKKIALPTAYHFVRECALLISSRPFVPIR